jgi:antirestriction protein ArdC
MAVTDTTRTDVARERLAEAVDALVTSEQWQAWLDSRARFHRYSFGNTLLIAFQRSDATLVAGFKAWQAMGRHVKKGEKGIAILAPIVAKVKSDDAAENVLDNATKQRGDTGRAVVGFRTVYVFDVAQTDGDALPDAPCRRLESDSGLTDAIDALVGHALAERLEIARQEVQGGANGYIDRAARRIVIDASLSRDQSFKTLCHELAHWHDLGPEETAYERDAAEIVAEATAYVIGQRLGLDTAGYSAGYVATWAGGDASRLHGLAERIDRAARPILTALE